MALSPELRSATAIEKICSSYLQKSSQKAWNNDFAPSSTDLDDNQKLFCSKIGKTPFNRNRFLKLYYINKSPCKARSLQIYRKICLVPLRPSKPCPFASCKLLSEGLAITSGTAIGIKRKESNTLFFDFFQGPSLGPLKKEVRYDLRNDERYDHYQKSLPVL